jgi:hypothetical protein
MKIMTVDEVLGTVIDGRPDDNTGLKLIQWGLDVNKNQWRALDGKNQQKNLCLAFSVLMAYAKGELVEIENLLKENEILCTEKQNLNICIDGLRNEINELKIKVRNCLKELKGLGL